MTLLYKNKLKILKKLPIMEKLFHSNQIDLNQFLKGLNLNLFNCKTQVNKTMIKLTIF